MKLFNILIAIILIINFSSCNTKKDKKLSVEKVEEKVFEDNFEDTLKPFWRKQFVDKDRYKIVQDPLSKGNKALKIEHFEGDYLNAGNRAELVVRPDDSIGYINDFSFKFMMPQSFFDYNELKWLIIHQWHDEVPVGLTWKTYNMKTKPPISLAIVLREGEYKLFFTQGLHNKNVNNKVALEWEESLKPNVWYHFKCEVLWSMDEDIGYARASINDIPIGKAISEEENSSTKANMFNEVPNYFKFGLYRNPEAKGTKTIFFDDFVMRSYKKQANKSSNIN